MTTFQIILLIAAVVVGVFYVLPRVVYILRIKKDKGGDENKGLVIFAESLRWLSVQWGKDTVMAGLRRVGFKGRILYWRHHAWWRAWLVLPAIADMKHMERQSQKLADFIAECRREHPGRPLHLIGYSAGAAVATRALELLPKGVQVDSVALLAAAISPWRDLNPAAEHVTGRFVVASSWADCFVVGLGTIISGTGDGKHTPSMGMLGCRGPGCPKVCQIKWKPAMLLSGNAGGHFTAASANFVARYVAPAMGICSPGGTAAQE